MPNTPRPTRHPARAPYDERVRDAMKMMLHGESREAVKQKHGRFVLEDALIKWNEIWQKYSFNTEGHAILRVLSSV